MIVMNSSDTTEASKEQNRARGFGCLAIVAVLLLLKYPMDQAGQFLGVRRDATDTAGILRWHFWSLAWMVALPLSLFFVSRLFRNTKMVRYAFPNCGSLEFIAIVLLIVFIYGLIGGVWLMTIGKRGIVLPILLSLVIGLLVISAFNKRRRDKSRETIKEILSSDSSKEKHDD